jgi:hypothetical protein
VCRLLGLVDICWLGASVLILRRINSCALYSCSISFDFIDKNSSNILRTSTVAPVTSLLQPPLQFYQLFLSTNVTSNLSSSSTVVSTKISGSNNNINSSNNDIVDENDLSNTYADDFGIDILNGSSSGNFIAVSFTHKTRINRNDDNNNNNTNFTDKSDNSQFYTYEPIKGYVAVYTVHRSYAALLSFVHIK